MSSALLALLLKEAVLYLRGFQSVSHYPDRSYWVLVVNLNYESTPGSRRILAKFAKLGVAR